MGFKVLHTFTPEERKVVEAAHQRFLHTIEVIAHIHGVFAPCIPLPDGSGIGVMENAPQEPVSH